MCPCSNAHSAAAAWPMLRRPRFARSRWHWDHEKCFMFLPPRKCQPLHGSDNDLVPQSVVLVITPGVKKTNSEDPKYLGLLGTCVCWEVECCPGARAIQSPCRAGPPRESGGGDRGLITPTSPPSPAPLGGGLPMLGQVLCKVHLRHIEQFWESGGREVLDRDAGSLRPLVARLDSAARGMTARMACQHAACGESRCGPTHRIRAESKWTGGTRRRQGEGGREAGAPLVQRQAEDARRVD